MCGIGKKMAFSAFLLICINALLFGDAPMKWVKKGWAQKGVASWYGGKFQGRLTANGEYFDTYKLTAAHKTLPFNTIVRVKNLDTGKTVDVRVNDRGPFVKNRIIDLSFAAAKKIDMTKSGTARVVIQVIKPGDNATYHHLHKNGVAIKSSGKEQSVWIQVGAFSSEKNGINLKKVLTQKGVEACLIKSSDIYRVGVISNPSEADKVVSKLKALGHDTLSLNKLPKGERL